MAHTLEPVNAGRAAAQLLAMAELSCAKRRAAWMPPRSQGHRLRPSIPGETWREPGCALACPLDAACVRGAGGLWPSSRHATTAHEDMLQADFCRASRLDDHRSGASSLLRSVGDGGDCPDDDRSGHGSPPRLGLGRDAERLGGLGRDGRAPRDLVRGTAVDGQRGPPA
jgi:hypothetical protein